VTLSFAEDPKKERARPRQGLDPAAERRAPSTGCPEVGRLHVKIVKVEAAAPDAITCEVSSSRR
jgi:hypothetical protein